MLLYHFTGLRALVGVDGLAAMVSHGGDCDASDFAAPGSILADGIRPSKDDSYNGALRSPLPPCVWLTDNPAMMDGFSSFSDHRISVVVPSSQRLVRWPEYWRKHARGDASDGLLAVPDAMRREADRFDVFFGKIPPRSF